MVNIKGKSGNPTNQMMTMIKKANRETANSNKAVGEAFLAASEGVRAAASKSPERSLKEGEKDA
jgi:hypothetical protein